MTIKQWIKYELGDKDELFTPAWYYDIVKTILIFFEIINENPLPKT